MFRHRFDPSSLVVGLLFLGLALRYLTAALGGDPVLFVWATPAALTILAVTLLLRLAFHSRRRERRSPRTPAR